MSESESEIETTDETKPESDTTTIQNQPYSVPLEGRIPFSREDLINAKELRTSDFGRDLYMRIMEANIYASAKRALLLVAANYTSSGLLLANLQKGGGRGDASFSNDILGAKISLELDMLIARTAMYKSDTRSADLLNIITAIRSHAKFLITRAQGAQRERILNSKISQSMESTVTQRMETPLIEPQQQPRKKKFWERG